MPYIWISGLWPDYGRRPLDQVSKLRFLGFSSSPWNFWSNEHNHALYWKFRTLAGLSRPQAQMTMGPIQKTFLVLRPFKRALTCSILVAGTEVVLRKAYFLRWGSWLRPEYWTPRPRIQNSKIPYYWGAHTNGLMFKISALLKILLLQLNNWKI
jgi:hypothetical protein